MAKKAVPCEPVPAPNSKIRREGWRGIAAGIAIAAAGFWTLTYADPMGRNEAAAAAPFVILGGYAVMALGIFL
jgi:hypothetical protein